MVLIFELDGVVVEVQGRQLPYVWIPMELLGVDDDGAIVDISTYPKLVSHVGTGCVLAIYPKPSNFCGNDGAGRQNWANLVAHGCATGLLKNFPIACKGTSVKAELDDL